MFWDILEIKKKKKVSNKNQVCKKKSGTTSNRQYPISEYVITFDKKQT